MIYVKAKYPWGEKWLKYTEWEFIEITYTKERGQLGKKEWVETDRKEEKITLQGHYASKYQYWDFLKSLYSKEYNTIEFNSNCFEVNVNETTKRIFFRRGHLDINTKIENTKPSLRDCLVFLDDRGWSELIYNRWKNDVIIDLKENIPFLTNEVIQETLNTVII